MANDQNEKRDPRSAEEKLASAQAQLHTRAQEESALRAQIAKLESDARVREEQVSALRDAAAVRERELARESEKLVAATAVATADIGKRPIALVDIIDHECKRDENGDAVKDVHGNVVGLKRIVRFAKGSILPFDPARPPAGLNGLKEGQQYAYR